MPRFTISSLLVGIVLALVAVYVLNVLGVTSIRRAIVSGAVAIGQEKANDFSLADSDTWDGGLDAATW